MIMLLPKLSLRTCSGIPPSGRFDAVGTRRELLVGLAFHVGPGLATLGSGNDTGRRTARGTATAEHDVIAGPRSHARYLVLNTDGGLGFTVGQSLLVA